MNAGFNLTPHGAQRWRRHEVIHMEQTYIQKIRLLAEVGAGAGRKSGYTAQQDLLHY